MSWYTFEHKGKKYRLAAARDARGVWIGWPGGSAFFAPQAASGGADADSKEIRAPMTGRIVQVRVKAGSPVKERELLVVLEAMKMEYRLSAPRDGSVGSILCREGQMVDLGEILLTLR